MTIVSQASAVGRFVAGIRETTRRQKRGAGCRKVLRLGANNVLYAAGDPNDLGENGLPVYAANEICNRRGPKTEVSLDVAGNAAIPFSNGRAQQNSTFQENPNGRGLKECKTTRKNMLSASVL